jgi:hypothetical protein
VTSVRLATGQVLARTAVSGGAVPTGATLARVGTLVIAATRDAVVAYG